MILLKSHKQIGTNFLNEVNYCYEQWFFCTCFLPFYWPEGFIRLTSFKSAKGSFPLILNYVFVLPSRISCSKITLVNLCWFYSLLTWFSVEDFPYIACKFEKFSSKEGNFNCFMSLDKLGFIVTFSLKFYLKPEKNLSVPDRAV